MTIHRRLPLVCIASLLVLAHKRQRPVSLFMHGEATTGVPHVAAPPVGWREIRRGLPGSATSRCARSGVAAARRPPARHPRTADRGDHVHAAVRWPGEPEACTSTSSCPAACSSTRGTRWCSRSTRCPPAPTWWRSSVGSCAGSRVGATTSRATTATWMDQASADPCWPQTAARPTRRSRGTWPWEPQRCIGRSSATSSRAWNAS